MNKFSRRDMQALEREVIALKAENALLHADNANLRERSVKLLAGVQRMMDELGKTTMEHHTEEGIVRRGPFWDVLAIDGLETWCVGNDSGGPHRVQ